LVPGQGKFLLQDRLRFRAHGELLLKRQPAERGAHVTRRHLDLVDDHQRAARFREGLQPDQERPTCLNRQEHQDQEADGEVELFELEPDGVGHDQLRRSLVTLRHLLTFLDRREPRLALVECFLQRQADVAGRRADVVDPSTARDVVTTEMGHCVGREVIERKLFFHMPVEVLRDRATAERPFLGDFKPLHATSAIPTLPASVPSQKRFPRPCV
jgi:hypothetical protein